MYNNLDYSSLGLGPETYHSPQGQGLEAHLTPVRVTPHHSVLQILEFCDATELIVANTCFRRQKNKLATYVSGGTMSATDYIYLLLSRCDRQHIKNVKFIAGEECVSQHRLLVGDVVVSSPPRKKKRMHIPRLKVWKLRESNAKQEFARLVTDKKDKVFETDNLESKWKQIMCLVRC